jgi:hypothetical protein
MPLALNPRVRGTAASPFLNRSQVDQLGIGSRERIATNELDFMKQRYSDVLSMYKNALSRYGQGRGSTVPSQFGEAVNLFQPGGQYGSGTERAIQTGSQQAIAAGNIASAATGMGSSTAALARTRSSIRDATTQRMLANERRLELLGGALGQAGQATLETQRIDAARQDALIRTLASLG